MIKTKKHVFTTSRWQYLFNATIKNLELCFLTAVGVFLFNISMVLFSQDTSIGIGQVIFTFIFMFLGCSIISVGYYWLKIKLLKSSLPTIVIDDKGVSLDDFSEEKAFS